VSYVSIAATMTTTRSAPITHSAVDENVHSYMVPNLLFVFSSLDARCGAKVYKTRARHVGVFRVKMRRGAIKRAVPHAVRRAFSESDGGQLDASRAQGSRKRRLAML